MLPNIIVFIYTGGKASPKNTTFTAIKDGLAARILDSFKIYDHNLRLAKNKWRFFKRSTYMF